MLSSFDGYESLPARDQFEKAGGYYAWRCTSSGIGRDTLIGTEGYAREELRVEIASLILGSEFGIGSDPKQHAGYVDHWIRYRSDHESHRRRAPNCLVDAKMQKVVCDGNDDLTLTTCLASNG